MDGAQGDAVSHVLAIAGSRHGQAIQAQGSDAAVDGARVGPRLRQQCGCRKERLPGHGRGDLCAVGQITCRLGQRAKSFQGIALTVGVHLRGEQHFRPIHRCRQRQWLQCGSWRLWGKMLTDTLCQGVENGCAPRSMIKVTGCIGYHAHGRIPASWTPARIRAYATPIR